MNIFVLDRNPVAAASMLCDKHVVKMVLETAQILSTIAHLEGFDAPYRPTHANHPCTKWARASQANYDWLVKHGKAIAKEYFRRYSKIHKSQAVIDQLGSLDLDLPSIGLTEFAQAMPDQYRNKDAVLAYRSYYLSEKRNIATWKLNNEPHWWHNV